MKKHAVLATIFILFLSLVSGCPQKRSPAAPIVPISGASAENPAVIAFEPVLLQFCHVLQADGGVVVINSSSEYDDYILKNGVNVTVSQPAVDYSNKTLISLVYPFVGGSPWGLKYDNIVTDGTTTTVNATKTSRSCPGLLLGEGCASFSVIADKVNTPVVFNITNVYTDCAGNTVAPPVWVGPPLATP